MQAMRPDTQTDFTAGLLTGGAVPEGVVDPDGKPAPKRYGVYQNNVVVSLIEALKMTFPAIVVLIGETQFTQMARAFIVHSQPQSPVLAKYGREIPEFLNMSEPLQHMPFLADVARLELVWLDCYHGADADPLSPQMFAELGDDALITSKFAFHPCTQVLSSEFALFDIWDAGRRGTALDNIDPNVSQGALVTRPDVEVLVVALTPTQVLFFSALGDGAVLGDAVEAAMSAGDFDLPASLGLMISSGALTSVLA